MSYLGSLLGLFICAGLFACGGGGGGSNSPINGQQSSSQQSAVTQSSVSSVGRSSSSTANVDNPITRKSAPLVAGAFADALEVSNNFSEEIYDLLSSYRSIPDSVRTLNCDKGLAKVTISNNGLLIEELFEACQLGQTEVNGTRLLEIVSIDSLIGSKINYSYKQMNFNSVSNPLLKTTIDGLVTYIGRIPTSGDSDSLYSATVNLTIGDSQEGRLEIKNFSLEDEYNFSGVSSSNLHENLARMKSVSGDVAVNGTRFSVESLDKGVVLKGDNSSRVSVIGNGYSRAYITWDETGDGVADANLTIPYQREALSISDMIANGDHKIVLLTSVSEVNQIYEGAQIYMGRGGSADIYVHWNFTSTSASLLSYELNGNATNGAEWTQLEPGHFKFSFPSNQVDTNYDLVFTATDTEGNKSPEIHAKIYVGVDTDKDGIPNISDGDDDGDRVADERDVFPLNPKESSDTDGDGVGDNTDPDNDFSVQRGFIWFVDKDGVVYFKSNFGNDYEERVSKSFSKRWDPKTNTFLDQLVLANYGGYHSYYSAEQNRLYYTSSNSDIYYINLSDMKESLFIGGGVALEIVNIVSVESNIVVISRSINFGTTYETYNDRGQLLSSIAGSDSMRNTIPFYSPQLALFCNFYVSFDSVSNLYKNGSYSNDKCTSSFVSVSPDGSYVYRGDGPLNAPVGIYTSDGNILTEINDGFLWLSNNLIVKNVDSLVLYSPQGVELKRYPLPSGATIQKIVSNDDHLVISFLFANYVTKVVALNENLEVVSEHLSSGI